MSITRSSDDDEVRSFLLGIARGTASALLFSLPMLMTMEMWTLGLHIDRARLLLLCALNLPLLVLLSNRIGFEKTDSWSQAARDAVTAYGIGIVVSVTGLLLIGVYAPDTSPHHFVAQVAMQSVPTSIGALLGASQFGTQEEDDSAAAPHTYPDELFMMLVGALFMNLDIAPTEEMTLIAYQITPYHTLALCLVSIVAMHAFVYAVSFRGSHEAREGQSWWHPLLHFTLPGYLIAVTVSVYILWTFGRLDHTSPSQILTAGVILGVPGSIGAAAARLIL